MLQALPLEALPWNVRGDCRTGKKTRLDITTVPHDHTTCCWDGFLACVTHLWEVRAT